MFTCFIKRKRFKQFFLLGITVCMVNFLSLRYMAQEDMEQVDLKWVAGKRVVIDAGHGGIDSGARYNHLLEKDITLAISMKLGALLQRHGAQVIYTREDDRDYYTKGKGGKRHDLLTRVDMINQSAADVFVSIHCNAVKDGQWSGSQVFYHPQTAANVLLAERLQVLLRKYPPNNKRQAKADEKILILKEAKIPGVLLETGYLSNAGEAKLLSDQGYQQSMAEQVVKALAGYFQSCG